MYNKGEPEHRHKKPRMCWKAINQLGERLH